MSGTDPFRAKACCFNPQPPYLSREQVAGLFHQAGHYTLVAEQEGLKRLATFKAGRYHDVVLMARIRPDLA